MNIYVGTLIVVAGLGFLLGGQRKYNRKYIILVAIILFLLCALRGNRVGSDLGRYETHYDTCFNTEWLKIPSTYQWSNIGFYYLCKVHSFIFGHNFHGFLVFVALIQSVCLTRLIIKTSVNPYLSYLMYIALGYYVFTYSGLKQAMATAFIMLALICIFEKKKLMFCLMVALAASMHFPAIIFIPAYFWGKHKLRLIDTIYLAVVVVFIYLFREQIVVILSDAYGTVVEETAMAGVGGKLIMMVGLIMIGLILRIPQGNVDEKYSCVFNFMIAAVLLQIFAAYGNVFERLADYYFVFAIIYIPYVFERKQYREEGAKGILSYNYSTHVFVTIAVFLFALVYYYSFIGSSVGLLPYKFY